MIWKMNIIYGQGIGSKGSKIDTIFYHPRDTGHLDTARLLGECGLSLSIDEEKLPSVTTNNNSKNNNNHDTTNDTGGGFFTPSYALGDVLFNRLIRTGAYFDSKLY